MYLELALRFPQLDFSDQGTAEAAPAAAAAEAGRRRDVVAAGVRRAAELIVTGHVIIRDKRADFEEFQLAADWRPPVHRQGWGRKPERGSMYGASNMEAHRQFVTECFNRGVADKNAKISPDQVVEDLIRRHPHTFCLPAASAVQTVYSTLSQKKKRGGDGGGGGSGGGGASGRRGRVSKLPADVVTAIDDMVERDPSLMPAAVLAAVSLQFPTSTPRCTRQSAAGPRKRKPP